MDTVIFTGFYGVGKTINARLLSARKNLDMIDLEEIKNNYEILNAKTDFLDKLKPNDKIATLDNDYIKDYEFRNIIKSRGKVIYLKSSPYTIYENIKSEYKNHHFDDNSFNEKKIEELYKDYENYYLDMATFVINIDYIKIENVFSKVLAIYNYINKVHCHIYFK